MELLSNLSADEVRQLTEGELQEQHEVRNVQVLQEDTSILNVELLLTDEDGVFLDTEALKKPLKVPADLVNIEHKQIH